VADDFLSGASEPVLVALARQGNDAAFTDLVRRRERALRGFLSRLTGDPTLADDLAQEAFVQAWRRLATLRSPESFGAWLRQIAINVWLRHARLKRLLTDRLDDSNPDDYVLPSGDTRLCQRVDLETALGRLSPHQRLCIVLAYQEGMSHAEIAQVARIPLGTVKSHITRATAKLREWLGPVGSAQSR
jgi:RNA polymerase sigma-70 factor, ECF subfamily